MIIDLTRFLSGERPFWEELEKVLMRLESEPTARLDLTEARRFHFLYQRAAADLARVQTFASEPQVREYLESLVLRAYGEIHETREKGKSPAPWKWLFRTFPRTFRRHLPAFWLALGITLVGCAFGGIAVAVDPDAREAILPFAHLQDDPARRVAREERAAEDRLAGSKSTFSAFLMTHNIRVSVLALALGMTWGIGTIVLLFSNGVMLGAVVIDYMLGGQTAFVIGWLLPHGAIEIPAILLAGQAGLVLAGALLGRGGSLPLRGRLRRITPELSTLILGVAILLVWAGAVEAFLSQYHEPFLPYSLKIAFGSAELLLLIWFLARCGAKTDEEGRALSHAR